MHWRSTVKDAAQKLAEGDTGFHGETDNRTTVHGSGSRLGIMYSADLLALPEEQAEKAS